MNPQTRALNALAALTCISGGAGVAIGLQDSIGMMFVVLGAALLFNIMAAPSSPIDDKE